MDGTIDQDAISAFKERQRAMWSAGDYPSLDHHIAEVGEAVVARASLGGDDEVLDIACGAGNATLPAARKAKRVTGLDLAPALLEAGRARAAEAGLEVEWVEGDAEALPFTDASFDVVISVFGVIFAPRHGVAASEAARVLRPGGRLALAVWTMESPPAELIRIVGSHAPPPPDFVQPPYLWGSEDHLAGLFAGTGVELELERRIVRFAFGSVEAALAEYGEKFGALVALRSLLEPEGRWTALEDDLRALFERLNTATDGSLVYDAEYLLVTGRKE